MDTRPSSPIFQMGLGTRLFHSYDKHMIILYHLLMQLLDGFHYLYRTSSRSPTSIHLAYCIMWVTCCVCAVAKCGVFRHFPRYDEHMIILHVYHALMQLLDGSTVCVFSLYPTMWVSPTAADTCSKKVPKLWCKINVSSSPGEPEWAAHSADFTM